MKWRRIPGKSQKAGKENSRQNAQQEGIGLQPAGEGQPVGEQECDKDA